MNPSLPVLRIVGDSLSFVWRYRKRLARALALLISIALLLDYLRILGRGGSGGVGVSPYSMNTWDTLLMILQTGIYSLIAITCHRLALMEEEESVPRYGMLRWGKRETWFTVWVFATTLLFMLNGLMFPIIFNPLIERAIQSATENNDLFWINAVNLAAYASMVPFYYIAARFSVVFPGTAVDHEIHLSSAWALTRNNGWRLTLIVGFFPVAFMVLSTLLFKGMPEGFSRLLFLLGCFILLSVGIVALSLSYRFLIENLIEPEEDIPHPASQVVRH